MKIKKIVCAVFCLLFFVLFNNSKASTFINEEVIYQDLILSASNSPYILDHSISLYANSSLILEPGSTLILNNDPAIIIDGSLKITGSSTNKTRIEGDGLISVYGYNVEISNVSTSLVNFEFLNSNINISDSQISGGHDILFDIKGISKVKISSSTFSGGEILLKLSDKSNFKINNSIFIDSYGGILIKADRSFLSAIDSLKSVLGNIFGNKVLASDIIIDSEFNNIKSSNFTGMEGYGIFNNSSNGNFINASENWWGDQSGPRTIFNPSGKGVSIIGNVTYNPWLNSGISLNQKEEIDSVENDCCSNIVFLPGIEGSRLYINKSNGELSKVWEPKSSSDISKIYLDGYGNSINNIEVGSVIDSAFGVIGIYKSFLEFLDIYSKGYTSLEGEINSWKVYPYDWRKMPDEVVDGIIEDFLIENKKSRNGKTSIIAHSYGGLVAKALIKRLEEKGLENIVDKVIFVAVPQSGTTETIFSILHGDNIEVPKGTGLIASKEVMKGLAENMKSALTLLPSKKLFDLVSSIAIKISDSVIENIPWFPKIYGAEINTNQNLINFLTGENYGRKKPLLSDEEMPNVVSLNLLSIANAFHDKYDSYNIPNNIEIFSIIGTGIKTIESNFYDSKMEKECDNLFDCGLVYRLIRGANKTIRGDGTVLTESAKMIKGVKLYFDLGEYNKNERSNIKINNKHADILEIKNIQDVINKILKDEITSYEGQVDENVSLPKYISKSDISSRDSKKYNVFSVYSPVEIKITDNFGRRVGYYNPQGEVGELYNTDMKIKIVEIPDASIEDNGVVSVSIPSELEVKVELIGVGEGFFTLTLDESVTSDTFPPSNSSSTKEWKDIPVNTYTKAILEYSKNSTVNPDGSNDLIISIDSDGNGIYDVTIKNNQELTIDQYFKIFKSSLNNWNLSSSTLLRILKKLDSYEKYLLKRPEMHNKVINEILLPMLILKYDEVKLYFNRSKEDKNKENIFTKTQKEQLIKRKYDGEVMEKVILELENRINKNHKDFKS